MVARVGCAKHPQASITCNNATRCQFAGSRVQCATVVSYTALRQYGICSTSHRAGLARAIMCLKRLSAIDAGVPAVRRGAAPAGIRRGGQHRSAAARRQRQLLRGQLRGRGAGRASVCSCGIHACSGTSTAGALVGSLVRCSQELLSDARHDAGDNVPCQLHAPPVVQSRHAQTAVV